MNAPTPAAGKIKLIRPAAIELRFSNKTQYKRHVRFYLKALGVAKKFNPPKDPKPYTHADSSFAFRVGMVPQGWADQDIQLRFVLLKQKQVGKNRTVIYWKIDKADFTAIKDTLIKTDKLGYSLIESLHPITTPADADSASALLGLEDAPIDTSALMLSAKNGIGNSVGLVINPPYPRIIDSDNQSHGLLYSPTALLLGVSLLSGLLGWRLLGGFFPRPFRQKLPGQNLN